MSSSLVFYGNRPNRKKRVLSSLENERNVEFIAQMIREGSDYKWESKIEKKIWTDVAKSIIKDHARGKRTTLSEACIRAYFDKKDMVLIESRMLLNEGFFSGLSDMVGGALAKTFGKAFGGTKSRNMWIFGGGGEKETEKYRQAYIKAVETNQEVFAKLGEKTLNNLMKQIKEVNKDFPNEGSGKDFTDAMSKITQYYELIRMAAGAANTAGEKPDADQPPKLSIDDANAIIRKMRELIEVFDRQLDDRYTLNLESRTSRLPTLAEALLNEEKDDEDEIGAEGRMTSSMKYLKSNLAPAVLAALGAAGVAAGVFSQSDLFKKITSTVVKHVKTNPGSPEVPATWHDETLGQVTRDNGGKGFVKYDNMTGAGKKIDFGSDPKDVLKKLGASHGGDATVEGGLKVLKDMHKSGVLGKDDPDWDEHFKEISDGILSTPPKFKTFMSLIKFGSGTHKKFGDFWSMDVGPITRRVQDSLGKAAVEATTETTYTTEQSEMGKKLTAAGPMEVIIGMGLMAAAACVKALRSYGAKNSRTTYFQAALDLFKDLKPDEIIVAGGGEGEDPIPKEPPYVPPPPVEKGKVTVEIDNKVVKVVAPKDVIESGGFEIRPTFKKEDVPIGDKKKAQQEVIDYLASPAGKASVPFVSGKSSKDVEGLEFTINDARKEEAKKSAYSPGRGTPAVIAIKDHKLRPLYSFLFEDADLRIIGSDEAKKSKEIKKLKKDFKANATNLPLPTNDTIEKTVMNDYMKLPDKDFELKAAPGDKGVQAGLDALRKKLKTGNAILTFSTSAVEKLSTFGIDDDAKRKMILQVYASDPAAAPDTTEKYNAFITANVDQDKRKDFAQFLVDTGLAQKLGDVPKGKAGGKGKGKSKGKKDDKGEEKPKKKRTRKAAKESFDFGENTLVERWQTLAGLLKS